MRNRYILLICFCLIASVLMSQNWQDIYLQNSLNEPNSYVIKEFEKHEIIFIGELHYKKQDLEFLCKLIPHLHSNGINTLFYEFLPIEENKRIDSLLNAKTFNKREFINIMVSHYWEFPYKEYVDVLYEVWKVNHKEKLSTKFKVIGMSNNSDWTENRMRNWTEESWANIIYEEAILKKKKALVYCGASHSMTRFSQTYTLDGKTFGLAKRDRVGHYLFKKIGDRCMTIWLYDKWPSKEGKYCLIPFNGAFEKLISELPMGERMFGFNTKVSPLGNLIDSVSLHSMGYEKFLKLSDAVDGYIVLNSIHKNKAVKVIPKYINMDNLPLVEKQLVYFKEQFKYKNAKDINDTLYKRYQKFILHEIENLICK